MSQKFQNNLSISNQFNPKIRSIQNKSCISARQSSYCTRLHSYSQDKILCINASRTWHLSTTHTSIPQFVNTSAIHNPLTILAQSLDQRAGVYRTRAAPPLSCDNCSPTLYQNPTVSGKTQQSQQRLEKDDQVSESPVLAVRFASEVYPPPCVQHYTANPHSNMMSVKFK